MAIKARLQGFQRCIMLTAWLCLNGSLVKHMLPSVLSPWRHQPVAESDTFPFTLRGGSQFGCTVRAITESPFKLLGGEVYDQGQR